MQARGCLDLISDYGTHSEVCDHKNGPEILSQAIASAQKNPVLNTRRSTVPQYTISAIYEPVIEPLSPFAEFESCKSGAGGPLCGICHTLGSDAYALKQNGLPRDPDVHSPHHLPTAGCNLCAEESYSVQTIFTAIILLCALVGGLACCLLSAYYHYNAKPSKVAVEIRETEAESQQQQAKTQAGENNQPSHASPSDRCGCGDPPALPLHLPLRLHLRLHLHLYLHLHLQLQLQLHLHLHQHLQVHLHLPLHLNLPQPLPLTTDPGPSRNLW